MTDAPFAARSDLPHASLWDELRDVLRAALALFGEPGRLFDDRVLPCVEARQLRAWIASLEAIARALVFALAATLPAPEPARRRAERSAMSGALAPSADRLRPAGASPTEIDGPETGEPEPLDLAHRTDVAFRIAPRPSRNSPSGPCAGPQRFLFVRGLARRFEAVIRVATSPERYARRLVRRLYADPGLATRSLRRPTGNGRRLPFDDLVDEALAAARDGVGAIAPATG